MIWANSNTFFANLFHLSFTWEKPNLHLFSHQILNSIFAHTFSFYNLHINKHNLSNEKLSKKKKNAGQDKLRRVYGALTCPLKCVYMENFHPSQARSRVVSSEISPRSAGPPPYNPPGFYQLNLPKPGFNSSLKETTISLTSMLFLGQGYFL